MSIGGQFTGLDMQQLIGAPLTAAADASIQLAHSTASFINEVGFDSNNKIRTANFGFTKKTENIDGSHNNDEMNVDVPLLAIVPIPNLQIDEVNVLFDMEVKESEKSESSKDMGGTFSGTANFGIFKATVSGSVSSHESNTRSSDNSAKYHVDVRASNHGTPEGLARVLDMMAACVAPELIGSTVVGEDGKPLEGERKTKIQKLKTLQSELMSLNRKVNAANDSLEIKLNQIKKEADNKQRMYLMRLTKLLEKSSENKDLIIQYQNKQEIMSSQWNDFVGNIKSRIEILSSFQVKTEDEYKQYIELQGVTPEGQDEDALIYLNPLITLALGAMETVKEITKQAEDKQDEFNQLNLGM